MHSSTPLRLPAEILIAATILTSPLVATDGMNMEGYGICITHAQLNTQLMCSYRF